MRRTAAAAAAALAACLAVLPATAQAQAVEEQLASRLAKALRAPGLAPKLTTAVAVDLESGADVIARLPGKPLRPASTEKLTVAVAALDELGRGFRIETVVLGDGYREGTAWVGDLVLEGHGDPSLHGDDLSDLAAQVRALGIRRVTGRVLGDESFFDTRRVAPGWKPSYYKDECPPLSALVVDRAVLDGRVVDEPALAAAVAFRRSLVAAGVRVAGRAAIGAEDEEAVELARVVSPPLRRLVWWMNTESDNFVAEMLLKQLGAVALGEGTTAAGARVARRELAERGVPLAGVRIVDGSGLSSRDRLTARALAALLVSARADERIAGSFIASLAVAGSSGTLADRMETPPARGRVRAKTGTTDAVSALAGYVGDDYAFAILMNGSPVPVETARQAQDRFAQILAGAA